MYLYVFARTLPMLSPTLVVVLTVAAQKENNNLDTTLLFMASDVAFRSSEYLNMNDV